MQAPIVSWNRASSLTCSDWLTSDLYSIYVHSHTYTTRPPPIKRVMQSRMQLHCWRMSDSEQRQVEFEWFVACLVLTDILIFDVLCCHPSVCVFSVFIATLPPLLSLFFPPLQRFPIKIKPQNGGQPNLLVGRATWCDRWVRINRVWKINSNEANKKIAYHMFMQTSWAHPIGNYRFSLDSFQLFLI